MTSDFCMKNVLLQLRPIVYRDMDVDNLDQIMYFAFPPYSYNLVVFILQGSSLGQFFSQYLEPIKLNDVKVSISVYFTPFCCIATFHRFPISFIKVDWKAMDLGYLTEVIFTELWEPYPLFPFHLF